MSIQVGQAAGLKRTFLQSDFDRFAALSGDDNPIHVDAGFAARTKFGRTVAHGMFLYSVVCGLLGTRLPGPGTMQLEQELVFPNATYAGEEVHIQVEVTQTRPAEGLAELSTILLRPGGSAGLQGRTLVRLPGSRGHAPAPVPAAGTPVAGPSSPFKGFEIGQRAEIRQSFSMRDLAEYAELTGDANPLFTDPAYARGQGLEGACIPGGLLGGLFSYLLGTQLPGQGTNYLKQRLGFPKPAGVDQALVASVQVTRIRPEKQLVNLSTLCIDPAGDVVCQGEALVLVSDVNGQEVERGM